MLLFDFSQIVFSASLDFFHRQKQMIDINLLRHISLFQILNLKSKIGTNQEIILCLDGRNYWRKEVFPLYKQNRKKSREKDKFNWESFLNDFNQIKQEFKESLPFKIIEIYGAEADDSISVLCQRYQSFSPVIISSDKDFLQLQQLFKNVRQYSPFHKKFLTTLESDYNLFEHIVKGDSSDGIPNILSDDDVFMHMNKRSKPIRKTKIEEWKQYGLSQPEMFCDTEEMLKNFKRNRTLIDLTQIPKNIQSEIVDQFDNYVIPKGKLFQYLVDKKLSQLMQRGDF